MRTRFALRSLTTAAALSCFLFGSGALLATSATAAPGDPACAPTAEGGPAAPAPEAPCWVDVTPYPFGSDGDPVDPSRHDCTTRPAAPVPATDRTFFGHDPACYLQASSFAFRAWNRGLAAMRGSTPFGVWKFDGNRWFPDPNFPGSTTCRGDAILWAGKRDYWLVGPKAGADSTAATAWPALCRFNGVEAAWEAIAIPAQTLARIPLIANTTNRMPGAFTAGSCFAWDDCWFFGDYGLVMRWDGSALTDASHDPLAQPWLGTSYRAAATASTSSGPFGVAVGTTGSADLGGQVPGETTGAPPSQISHSSGGPFAPLGFRPPTIPLAGDPARTDLVAVGADARRRGWVAGNPAGRRVDRGFIVAPRPGTRLGATPEPAPIAPFSVDSGEPACTAPVRIFEFGFDATGRDRHLWSSLSVLAETGDALVGGTMRPAAAGSALNDDGQQEPMLVRVGCDGAVTTTRFRDRDPTAPAGSPLVPANRGGGFGGDDTGYISAVTANAPNDAWAATARGRLRSPFHTQPELADVWQRPHLYRLTDLARPDAPDGDDVEPRPLNLTVEPPLFIEDPPQALAPALGEDLVVTERPPPPLARPPARKATIYAVTFSKPRRMGRDRYILNVNFRVRRTITVGVQALRGKAKRRLVVSRSGLRRFRPGRARLALTLHRKRWPTGGIRFYTPTGAISAVAASVTAPRSSQR